MAYRSSSTASANTAGNTTGIAVAVPSSVAIGDVVCLFLSVDDSTPTVVTWPTGFTQFGALSHPTLDGHTNAAAWKRLTAVDSGTYAVTWNSGAIQNSVLLAAAWSGRHATTAPTATIATNSASNASPVSVNATTITAATNDDLCWCGALDVNATGIGNGCTPPTNYTERQDTENGWVNISIATRDAVSSGATGTITGTFALTSGAAGWSAFLVLLPVAASGTTDGVLSVTATSTVTFVGASLAASPLSITSTGAFTGVGKSDASGVLAITSSGLLTGVGRSTASSVLSITSLGTFNGIGKADSSGVLSIISAGALNGVGSSVASSVLNAIGISSVSFVGDFAGLTEGVFNSTSIGVFSGVGASKASSVLTITSLGQALFVGSVLDATTVSIVDVKLDINLVLAVEMDRNLKMKTEIDTNIETNIEMDNNLKTNIGIDNNIVTDLEYSVDITNESE